LIPNLRKNHKKTYLPYIKRKKPHKNQVTPSVFMEGDIETHPYPMGTDGGKSHLAYTVGYMVELSGKEIGTTGTYRGEDKSYYKSSYL
jgi:hypothetical protein